MHLAIYVSRHLIITALACPTRHLINEGNAGNVRTSVPAVLPSCAVPAAGGERKLCMRASGIHSRRTLVQCTSIVLPTERRDSWGYQVGVGGARALRRETSCRWMDCRFHGRPSQLASSMIARHAAARPSLTAFLEVDCNWRRARQRIGGVTSRARPRRIRLCGRDVVKSSLIQTSLFRPRDRSREPVAVNGFLHY